MRPLRPPVHRPRRHFSASPLGCTLEPVPRACMAPRGTNRVGGSMKMCLAGTGAMGEIHVKALAKIDGVEVVSVAGRTADGGAEFASKWKIPFGSTDLGECMDRPGVDAVILTTPSDQHC